MTHSPSYFFFICSYPIVELNFVFLKILYFKCLIMGKFYILSKLYRTELMDYISNNDQMGSLTYVSRGKRIFFFSSWSTIYICHGKFSGTISVFINVLNKFSLPVK